MNMEYLSKMNNIQKKNDFDPANFKSTYLIKPDKPKILNKIFIVHGHDSALKEEIARILEKQGIEVVLLSECANSGLTIFEKLEKYSEVDAAISLLTCDDVGKEKSEKKLKARARQNVIFETGYFIHKLGRDKVFLICDSEIEVPTDLQGVVYNTKDDWNIKILKELKEVGFDIDFNKFFN